LMLSLPGPDRGGRRVATQVRSIDIYPTILDVIGLPPPPQADGRSLRPLALGETTSFERQAWSYSGALGVSLRIGARAKFLLYDSVVERRSELDRFFHVDRDPGELDDRIAELAERPKLTREILERVNGRANGLRLSVGGLRPGETLGLRATWLAPAGVKWAGVPSDGVGWSDEGILTLTGRDTESLELLDRIEVPPVGELEIWLDGEERAISIAPESLAAGTRLRASFESGRFVRAEPANAGRAPRLEIWWQGEAGVAGVDPARADAALREQLRALGYL